MSMEVLLEATRDYLRTTASLSNERCDIQPGGRPPARMGETYVSIDEGPIQSTEKSSLREIYTVRVWITKRTGKYPADRRSNVYLDNIAGLGKLERLVIRTIHGAQALRVAANTLGGFPHANAGDIFQQPLWYTGRGPSSYVGAEWIGGEGENDTFLVRQLTFQGALRVQALDIMH